MARPKLYHPGQHWLVRWILWAYEFSASLKLAVVLISVVTFVLILATFVEANTGTAGVQWYFYQAPWFLWLLGALALNIFSAAAIRYPWKRHQTGFVITHIGLLTLLAGSAISYQGSVNSQMLVYLGQSNDSAVDHDDGFLLLDGLPGREEPLQFHVDYGPFNWSDLAPSKPWRQLMTVLGQDDVSKPWVHPPDVVFDDGQNKVEILDYYSRSEMKTVPFVELEFRQSVLGFEIPLELEYNHDLNFGQADFQGMGSVLMWRTPSEKQFRGFQECVPTQTVEGDGAVVIWFDGESEPFQFPVSRLQSSSDPFELIDGWTVELVEYAPSANIQRLLAQGRLVSDGDRPDMPAVELRFKKANSEKTDNEKANAEDVDGFQVVRFAQFPFTPNRKGLPDGFVVEFYHPMMKGRIDLLEGPENKLAYRVWQQKLARIVATGILEKGKPVSTWSMGGGEATWQMDLVRHVPESDTSLKNTDGSAYEIFPLPFDKDDPERGASRRIKVQVTSGTGDSAEKTEFWLRQNSPPPWQSAQSMQVEEFSLADGKKGSAMFRVRETPVGFTMRLDHFDLDVDPGQPMASNYTSEVSIIDREMPADDEADTKPADADVKNFIITMNEPLDYPDPRGRTLRFFQENYIPPRGRDPLGSIFRVNYDPGRWIKYLGSLLVCVGIFTMFYMRAYFSKPMRRVPVEKPPHGGTETREPSRASV